MKAKLYTSKGELKQEVALPKEYVATASKSLLLQAVRVLENNTHFGLNKEKTR